MCRQKNCTPCTDTTQPHVHEPMHHSCLADAAATRVPTSCFSAQLCGNLRPRASYFSAQTIVLPHRCAEKQQRYAGSYGIWYATACLCMHGFMYMWLLGVCADVVLLPMHSLVSCCIILPVHSLVSCCFNPQHAVADYRIMDLSPSAPGKIAMLQHRLLHLNFNSGRHGHLPPCASDIKAKVLRLEVCTPAVT